MRKVIVLLAVWLVFTAGLPTAFAGPFANVAADDWTYVAINQLVQDGLVGGVGESFGAGKELSRFEMAVLVGKALENRDKANLDSKVKLDRLAREFSRELGIFGVNIAAQDEKQDDSAEKIKNLENSVKKLEKLNGAATSTSDGWARGTAPTTTRMTARISGRVSA